MDTSSALSRLGRESLASQREDAITYRPGDAADFERLYRDTYRRVMAMLLVVLADPTAAEDCAQETFLRALAAWPRWRPEAPVEAWLLRIAINTARSYRSRQRLREVGDVLRRFGRPGPGQDPSQAGERAELLEALRRLPPEQSAVIVLRHYHGFSNREIGGALGVPERTVASRLAAAKRKLQAELSGWESSA